MKASSFLAAVGLILLATVGLAAEDTRLRLCAPAWRDIGLQTPQDVARKFEVIFGHLDPGPFHAGNPATRCFKYVLGPYVAKAELTRLPREALAADAKGDFVKARDWANWLVVPDNPQWLAHVRQMVARLMDSDFDGIFVDSMGTAPVASNYTLTAAINPHTSRPYTKAEWLAAERVMLAAVREALPKGKFVTLNGLGQGHRYWTEPEADSPRRLLEFVDGAMSESIWRDARATLDAWPSLERWQQEIRMIQDVDRRGLMGFWWTKCWTDGRTSRNEPNADRLVAQWLRFSLASYLLAAGPRSYFNFDTDRDDQPKSNAAEYFTEYEAPLGHALEPMRALGSDGVHARRFSRGVVLVNPTQATGRPIVLPWPELAGATFLSAGEGKKYSGAIAVPGHAGLILTLP